MQDDEIATEETLDQVVVEPTDLPEIPEDSDLPVDEPVAFEEEGA